ncbi:MAG: ABC transporter ATP-binding protein [Acidimicrobiia bacterium]|nr:ABC transporter ATP-binding protein [Acidimicrobiia bacterium]
MSELAGSASPPSADGKEAVITLEQVTVQYGQQAVLREVSAVFPTGAVGLLGPNGAGKSTLIRSLLGLITPTSGRMRVLGHDVAHAPVEIRARVGYMPESDAYMPGMNAVSCVAYCGELAGLPAADAMQRAHEMLFYVGLGDVRYRAVETYSTGMKQRLKLAQALVHDPDLVFLDEPTNGMDPRGRDEMLSLVYDLAHRKGVNVILSSHLLPDVEQTCDHVIVMYKGRVVTHGPMAELKQPRGQVFELRVKAPRGQDAFRERLTAAGLLPHRPATDEGENPEPSAETPGCRSDRAEPGDDEIIRVLVPGHGGARDLFTVAASAGVQVRHLRPSVVTLDDVFARAVGDTEGTR